MNICLVIKQRLEELGLEQRDLARAAEVTESYVSQLLSGKKKPPAAARTGLYEKMNSFLKLPKGRLKAIVEAQRREQLKEKLADPPAPLFREVRALILAKCKPGKRIQVRSIFEKQAFGELERLVTVKLLEVTKRIASDELQNQRWLRTVAQLRGESYERMRVRILEFLDVDVFKIDAEQCEAFLDPLIEAWDIDLETFGMEIILNRRLASTQFMRFHFLEMQSEQPVPEEPGFQEFLAAQEMSGDATPEELAFLRSIRFLHLRPTPFYYYRELQSLRDPLHFPQHSSAKLRKRRDATDAEKRLQSDSRKRAIQRWAAKRGSPGKKNPH